MKKIIVVLVLLFVGFSSPLRHARAQTPAVQVIAGTVSIDEATRSALEIYLTASPPSSAVFYAPTYYLNRGPYAYVSLAALNISSPDDPWSLEAKDGEVPTVIWVGTLRIWGSGDIEPLFHGAKMLGSPKMAAPIMPEPGGNAAIRLPFELGKSMQYGPRLIHGLGDYGTTGMYAVDLVGGDALGTNVASRNIYASAPGTIDYVCTDGTSVAIRTYNAPSLDTFVYAHLLANATLEMDQSFAAGQGIGALRYGSFNDTCGWADQGTTVYHIHWMFEPVLGAFRVGGYTITLSDGKFHTASASIGAGGWITNSVIGNGIDDPGGSIATPSIWDNIVGTVVAFVGSVAQKFPAHDSAAPFLVGAINTIGLMFKLAWVLLRGSFNLQPLADIALFIIAYRVVVGTIWLIFWAIRTFHTVFI